MFKRILVPLDGSERAERAIPVAARIARASGGTIVFVRVVLPPVEFGTYSADRIVALKPSAFETHLAEAESYLRNIPRTYADVLVDIETEGDITTGAPAPEIFSATRLEEIDLVVLCSHGKTGLKRWILRSVAQEAVRHSPAPILVLNEHKVTLHTLEATHPLHILVPLDGSALSESALEPAAHLIAALAAPIQSFRKYVRKYVLANHWNPQLFAAIAAPLQGELHLLRVVDLSSVYGKMKSQAHITDIMQEEARQEAESYVKSVTARCETAFAASNLHVTSSIAVSTDVAGTIIKLAEHAGGYDLIVMATHGRGGFRRLVMGSVTEQVLGETSLPLLIARPHGIDVQVQREAEGEETSDAARTLISVEDRASSFLMH